MTRKWNNAAHGFLAVMAAAVLATLPACIMNVEYARPGQSLASHDGKGLVFSRIRFFYNGQEFFPWDPAATVRSLTDMLRDVDRTEARHIWLRRLDVTAASWQLQPDKDGSLAIWLPAGDYALVGTEDDPTQGVPLNLAVVALLRVPAGAPAVYAGELVFADEFREGWHGRYVFGSGRVTTESMATATRTLEARYGALPAPPALSAWCVGEQVPSGDNNPEFARQSRQLLDGGCRAPP